MSYPETIDIDPLVGERLNQSHLPEWERLYSDPEVMRTLGGLRPAEWIEENLAEHIKKWEEYGFGLWLFRHKDTGDFVGRGGLHVVFVEEAEVVEVGYALLPKY